MHFFYFSEQTQTKHVHVLAKLVNFTESGGVWFFEEARKGENIGEVDIVSLVLFLFF